MHNLAHLAAFLCIVGCGGSSDPGPAKTAHDALDHMSAAISHGNAGALAHATARAAQLRAVLDCDGDDNVVSDDDKLQRGLAEHGDVLAHVSYQVEAVDDAGEQTLRVGDAFRGCTVSHELLLHVYHVTGKTSFNGQSIEGTDDFQFVQLDGSWWGLPRVQ